MEQLQIDQMSLTDLKELKSIIQDRLELLENWANSERGHHLEEYNRRYAIYEEDAGHKKIKRINDYINKLIESI